MKKLLCVLLTISMAMAALMFIGGKVNAVEARYAHTTSVTSTLSIYNGNAYCKSSLQGDSTVTSIYGTQYLEKKNGDKWDYVNSWSAHTSSNHLTLDNTEYDLDSGTYHVRAVFTVFSGSTSETVEKTSSEKTVS